MIERASPADLRKALAAAQEMAKAGIAFVPMPARNADDLADLQEQALSRLGQLADAAEEGGA